MMLEPSGEPQAPLYDVKLVGVSKTFGVTWAVRDLTLQVEQGIFYSLLGPSGCGKTTTLRLIAGFEQPTAGQVLIRGIDVAGLPPYRRDVNTVFQSYALFPHMSVADNIAYGLRQRHVSRAEIRRRVEQALEMVRLTGAKERRPAELSGGQQQRVALARALINRPTVLLLDEPLSALDLKLRKEMQSELKALAVDTPAPGDCNFVEGVITQATFLGAQNEYRVHVGGNSGSQDITVRQQNMGTLTDVKNLDDQDIELYRGWHVFGPGERVNLVWRHEASLILRESSAEGEQKDSVGGQVPNPHASIV